MHMDIRNKTVNIISTNNKISVTAIDLKKVFDSIKRDQIWKIQKARGINKKTTHLLTRTIPTISSLQKLRNF